jgi:hypothetical protein
MTTTTTTNTKTNPIDLKKLFEQFKTKSAIIRYLTSLGMTRSEVAKTMNIRYQHVRNVLITPVKNPKQV